MAGDWIQLRADIHADPAVIAVAARTCRPENEVVGALVWLWAWANGHTEDGKLTGVPPEWIDSKVGIPGFSAALRDAGWLNAAEGGVEIPNYERYNGRPAKTRAKARARSAKYRGRGQPAKAESPAPAEGPQEYKPPGQTLNEIRGQPAARPVTAGDRPDLYPAAKRLVARYDDRVKSAHTSKHHAASNVVAALADGHTEEQLAAVIDAYARQCEASNLEAKSRRACHTFFDKEQGSYLNLLEAAAKPRDDYQPPPRRTKI